MTQQTHFIMFGALRANFFLNTQKNECLSSWCIYITKVRVFLFPFVIFFCIVSMEACFCHGRQSFNINVFVYIRDEKENFIQILECAMSLLSVVNYS